MTDDTSREKDIEIIFDEPMSRHISFRLGGNAACFIRAAEKAVPGLLRVLRQEGQKYALLGNGTNLLVRDTGYDGAVIKITPDAPFFEGDVLSVSAGTPLAQAAVFAAKAGFSGLEFAHGIPGTVGGAVCMNAGAYGGEISQVLSSSDMCDEGGDLRTLSAGEHLFGYRQSFYMNHPRCTVLRARFKLTPGDRAEIEAKMALLAEKRRASQPLEYPSAGSVFKRPEGHFAGKLIEDCGLKGFSVGGAQVSEKHAGFIINTGNATCKDVMMLIRHIQKTVYARFGVTLEREVKIFGEE